ncbi:hypothetical protein OPV22_004681 [Ensete ventricosum]|uniref:Uncharacterized protein n=1 Tax=Ensete ventricosum TaxID=4639 RepID=A0AAV8RMG3_ENSVE|nr:hypothetical protein OPV22_004681 [Ensete ventricosum]RWV85684.1 hypothetical protein GW17_00052506 [Ensete ventricosum]RWW63057.1 hypothetical protein BHE74_00029821 [Ensete ventricosum]RZS15358.1 hypothetical protein BHM03_00047191 [Ensete ventricosum]
MGVDHWTLEEVTMDSGFPSSVWGFQEGIEDLKHKLLCATSELEALRANAKEEIRKNEENIERLIHHLQVITHERDVARDQLQLVLNKITLPDSPQPRQARGSCSVTESDSLSGAPNHHSSYGASPVDSFLDNVGSPELSSMGGGPQRQASQRSSPNYDRASEVVVDGLAMKKPLPPKGKLLQAVLEAGPLLQTLLLAGPLPQWRNPPPLQPFQVPPMGVNLHNASPPNQKPAVNASNLAYASPPTNAFYRGTHGYGLAVSNTAKRTTTSQCMKGFEEPRMKRQKTQCM